jgi:phage protein D
MTTMIASVDVKIGGSSLGAPFRERLLEVRVEDNLTLPDTFTIKIADPQLEKVDSNPLEIGKEVEILFEPPDGSSPKKVMKGQITSIEPEFDHGGVTLVARGYDYSHVLNRSKKTDTYQNMTYGDIARKVIGAAGGGVSAGTIDDKGGTQDFVQQSNETDWDFLWRLAQRIDNEVVAEDKKIHFRTAGGPSGGQAKELRWGAQLQTFYPRITGVQQVDEVTVRAWDHKTKDKIEVKSSQEKLGSKIGITRSSVRGNIGGGKVVIADRPVTTQAEAQALADGVITQLANSYLDATGTAKGDPDLKAGSKIEVKGIGSKFSGTYTLSSTVHLYRGSKGYITKFTISGRAPRGLVDLMTPSKARNWGNSVVIGVVTNNKDPDNLGRVRVKYPALGDNTEGWWARIATPSSGKDRGLLMMPIAGEEVLIAFEHDDVRKPYVLGSVWNAKDTPGNLVQNDGSFILQSDKQIQMKAKDPITVKGDKELTIDTTGKIAQKTKNDFTIDGQKIAATSKSSVDIKGSSTITVDASGSVTIKGASISVEASGSLTLKGSSVMIN